MQVHHGQRVCMRWVLQRKQKVHTHNGLADGHGAYHSQPDVIICLS
jgi:hypothetical protein